MPQIMLSSRIENAMDIYAAARRTEPDRALFARPGAAFRGAPFWSWNGRLERTRLLAQLDDLAAMGMGGAHIHSRTGLETPYLGEEFIGHARASATESFSSLSALPPSSSARRHSVITCSEK